MNSFATSAVALLLVCGFGLAHATTEEDPQRRRFASLTLENDFFVGFDRHYTNGVQLAFLAGVPEGLRDIPPFAWSAEPDFVVAVGQRIFTPEDKGRVHPDPADRPYAGWAYLMADFRVRSGAVIDHLTLNVGVVGPSAHGRQAQNALHSAIGEEPARGWDAQISDELTLMLAYERAWRGVLDGRLGERRYDLSPRVSAALGNVLTYASAGAVLRFGSELPDDLPATHISLGPPRDGYRGASRFGWYLWTGVDARAVAHNMFLEGHAAGDPGVERKPYGFDLQAGATLVWPSVRLGFAVVQRSREFQGQDKPDRFAQLSLSFAH